MKVLKTALLFLMCVSFSFSCKEGVKEVRVLKLAHGLPPSHSVHLGLLYMNERLKELSGGKMSMDIYSSAQLGSENQCIELLQIGSLDITKVSSAALEGFADPFKVFGIPYLFRSREQFFEVLDGSVGKQILGSTEPYWFRGLAYFDSGARSFYTVNKQIRTPEDLKGLKIRVQKSPIAVEMMKTFGGSATPVDWGELYTALQSNVVDGAENNTPSVTTAFHHEVVKYYSVNEHTHLVRLSDGRLLEKEIQLCCLLCAGFSTKEISVVTQQSVRTIYQRKTDIRHKLDMDEKEDIIGNISAQTANINFSL